MKWNHHNQWVADDLEAIRSIRTHFAINSTTFRIELNRGYNEHKL